MNQQDPEKRNKAQKPPLRWGKDMLVVHRITELSGEVLGVDFEEDLVLVQCGDYEYHWRIENVYEVLAP